MRRPLIASLLLCAVAASATAAFVHALAPGRVSADPNAPPQGTAQVQQPAPQGQPQAQQPAPQGQPQAQQSPPQGQPQAQQSPPQGQPQGQQPGGPGGPQPGMGGETPFDTSMAHADQMVADMIQRLGPKADAPAESVFKNIQLFKGQPASMVYKVMIYGFSRGLGVRCGSCHVRGDFASDEKSEKKVARAMWKMVGDINHTYLANMKDLDDEMPTVNCWTCHRGRPKPEMPVAR